MHVRPMRFSILCTATDSSDKVQLMCSTILLCLFASKYDINGSRLNYSTVYSNNLFHWHWTCLWNHTYGVVIGAKLSWLLQLGFERLIALAELNSVFWDHAKYVIECATLIYTSFSVLPWLGFWRNFSLSKQFPLNIANLVERWRGLTAGLISDTDVHKCSIF